MVSIPYLDKADLGPLADAAASWGALPAKYEALQREFEQRVINHLKGHWEGDAATAAFATMESARTEYANAATEAGRIAKLLGDAHTEFAAFQKQLQALLDEARADSFHVSEDGAIKDVDSRWDSPTASASPGFATERKGKLDSLSSRLTRVLELATAADEAASAALERDANGDSRSFNTSVYTSLDAVEIDQATAIAAKGDRATDAELDQLNRILHANSGDSEFTTGFYDKLGPHKTLDFYANLTAQADEEPDSRRFKEVQELQKNLGHSLATATDPDKQPHLSDAWSAELRAQGAQKFTVSDNPGYPYQPYGYQVLGGILRYGEYDSHFLTPIARHAVSLEAENPDIWIENSPRGSLNEDITSNPSGRGGDGFDPMTGILEGLGHSPEAAEDFFTGDVIAYHRDGTVDPGGDVRVNHGDGRKDVDSYLDYFTDPDRDWVPDTASRDLEESAKATRYGPDALGHALEAAVSGRAYDDLDGPPVKHSEGQAELMHDVVDRFGNDPGLISLKDGGALSPMTDSLGNMTAEYMWDVQKAMAGDSDNFTTYGKDAGLQDLNDGPLSTFIGAVSKDPDAYGAIGNAQQAVTTQVVTGALDGRTGGEVPTDKVKDLVAPGALISGIMEESRSQAVYDDRIASDEEFNKGLETGDKWVGRVVGMGTSKIPVAGDAVGWVVEDIQAAVVEHYTRDSGDEAGDEARHELESKRETGAQAIKDATATAGREAGLTEGQITDLGDAVYHQANLDYGDGRNRARGL
ncbi:hypothetical protein [Actinacidiphila glaucinigra]|uniref:hypothetical protein n=1 Tax=Actinacidiphila glaucinigra TaxID=235986 RepID=UPI0035DA4934